MSITIPNSLSSVRNARLVSKPYSRLRSKGIGHEQALEFSKGYVALEGHTNILSQEGIQLLERASAFVANDTSLSPADLEARIIETTPKLPTVADPKLQLFVNPSENLSEAEKNRIIQLFNSNPWRKSNVLQISRGCSNQCLNCGYDSEPRMIHMPYPMIIALARDLVSHEMLFEERYLRYYLDSDPFLYRDKAFDADFGDVMKALKRDNFDKYDHLSYWNGRSMHTILTHGWSESDKYAQAAGEKIHEYGIGEVLLTIHFLHKEIERNLYNQSKLERETEKYIQRFRNAIQTLMPNIKIRLCGMVGENIPEVFSLQYVRSIYHERLEIGLKHIITLSDLSTHIKDADGTRYEINPYDVWGLLVREGFIKEYEGEKGRNKVGEVLSKIERFENAMDFVVGQYNCAQNCSIYSDLNFYRTANNSAIEVVEERTEIGNNEGPSLISSGRGKIFAERLGISFPDGHMDGNKIFDDPCVVIFRPTGEFEVIHNTSEGSKSTVLHKLF